MKSTNRIEPNGATISTLGVREAFELINKATVALDVLLEMESRSESDDNYGFEAMSFNYGLDTLKTLAIGELKQANERMKNEVYGKTNPVN